MEYYTAIGIDVSDKTSKICMMEKVGNERRVTRRDTVATTRDGFTEYLADVDRSVPVTFETGTHSRWMRALIEDELGFEHVYVANPAKLYSIINSNTKNDANDAQELARLTLADPQLLHPVDLRGEMYQEMMRLAGRRDMAVRMRSQVTNAFRGTAKSMGYRIEKCSPESFLKLDLSQWPEALRNLFLPVRDVLKSLNKAIDKYERMMAKLARKPEFRDKIERVKEVVGVGDTIAPVFIAWLGGDVTKFKKPRDVGPALGQTPKQDQSGETDKQLHTTKAGNKLMRRLLVEGANVIMKESSKDTSLKLRGLRICLRGGKIAKGKAKQAVARALAVTMVALLKKPDMEYVPITEHDKEELAAVRAEIERRKMQKAKKAGCKTA